MKKIQINNDLCSKCGKCVKVCLTNVLSQEHKKAKIGISDTTHCNLCANCINICRRNAITIEGIYTYKKTFNEQIRTKGFALSLFKSFDLYSV